MTAQSTRWTLTFSSNLPGRLNNLGSGTPDPLPSAAGCDDGAVQEPDSGLKCDSGLDCLIYDFGLDCLIFARKRQGALAVGTTRHG